MKTRGIAILLALLLGGLGAHKFYLDKPVQGIFYVLFFWTFIPGIIAFFEILVYLGMTQQTFDEKYNARFLEMNK